MARPGAATRRIEAQTALPGLFDALVRLPASDLQSLLLEVSAARADSRTPADLTRDYAGRPILSPSKISARLMAEFDRHAYAAATSFEALDLSPVSPFATAHTLGGQSQNNVITTTRSGELSGDCTLALALECARRGPSSEPTRLCASQRVARLQPVDFPGFTPHFRLFGMVTAGRDEGNLTFELTHLREHIAVYLNLFRLLNSAGFNLASPLVEVTDCALLDQTIRAAGIPADKVREAVRAHRPGASEQFWQQHNMEPDRTTDHRRIGPELFNPLASDFPEAAFRLDQSRLEGSGYYRAFAFRISPLAPDGVRYPIIDGGFTNWTARLTGNAKQRLLISGIGSEFACRKFADTSDSATISSRTAAQYDPHHS